MNMHAHPEIDLTKNQSMVMNALSEASGPLTAYAILDTLRADGFRAPPQVYRALEKLMEFGMVHRIESLNAFVACQLSSCDGAKQETIVFTICERCKKVQEQVSHHLASAIDALASDIGFSPNKSVIELRGLCTSCAKSSTASAK